MGIKGRVSFGDIGNLGEYIEMYVSLERCGKINRGRRIERDWGDWGVEADVGVLAVPGALRDKGPEGLDLCSCALELLATGRRGPMSSSSSRLALILALPDDPISC